MRTIHAGHVWYAELYKQIMRLKCKPSVYIYNIAVANVLKVLVLPRYTGWVKSMDPNSILRSQNLNFWQVHITPTYKIRNEALCLWTETIKGTKTLYLVKYVTVPSGQMDIVMSFGNEPITLASYSFTMYKWGDHIWSIISPPSNLRKLSCLSLGSFHR